MIDSRISISIFSTTGAIRYAAHDGGLCSESDTAINGQSKAPCGTKYDANKGLQDVAPYSSNISTLFKWY